MAHPGAVRAAMKPPWKSRRLGKVRAEWKGTCLNEVFQAWPPASLCASKILAHRILCALLRCYSIQPGRQASGGSTTATTAETTESVRDGPAGSHRTAQAR